MEMSNIITETKIQEAGLYSGFDVGWAEGRSAKWKAALRKALRRRHNARESLKNQNDGTKRTNK